MDKKTVIEETIKSLENRLKNSASDEEKDGVQKHINSLKKQLESIEPELSFDEHVTAQIKSLQERKDNETEEHVIKGIEEHIASLEDLKKKRSEKK